MVAGRCQLLRRLLTLPFCSALGILSDIAGSPLWVQNGNVSITTYGSGNADGVGSFGNVTSRWPHTT
jgi:hypothetical protein